MMSEHVHMCLCISPKYEVAYAVGYLKGMSVIHIAWQLVGWKRNCTAENFWARSYFVATVELDEEMVRAYIRKQRGGWRYDQMKLGM